MLYLNAESNLCGLSEINHMRLCSSQQLAAKAGLISVVIYTAQSRLYKSKTLYVFVCIKCLTTPFESKLSKEQTGSLPNLNMFVCRRREEAAAQLHPVSSVEVDAELFLHLGQK